MFDPDNVGKPKRDIAAVEALARVLVPDELLRDDSVRIGVREVQCGDPDCSPIDTIIEFWCAGGAIHNGFGLPMRAEEVTAEIVAGRFPGADVLRSWARGEDIEWPKPSPPPTRRLQFNAQQRVEVHLAGHWRKATVLCKWYRDRNWPKSVYMPYGVEVDDRPGRTAYWPSDDGIREPAAGADDHDPSDDGDDGDDDGPAPCRPSWRFNVGDRVVCNFGHEWRAGMVECRDEPDPSGGAFTLLPYVVRLDAPFDRLISVPRDDSDCIAPQVCFLTSDLAYNAFESFRPTAPIRFAVGDAVEARIEAEDDLFSEWAAATVEALFVSVERSPEVDMDDEEGIVVPKTCVVAYQLKLGPGGALGSATVLAPRDDADLVRRRE
ncbi:hypothetical protein M885DRAFT_544879 [Pelagophyceae sp. CCMP2097]|nr:hypothetical protein M885DRAFT_544879 [Pelagophyceae sp. CCMP2097]|mmetsp:Transcript_30745/g.103580  ORF Transcript_30745/g.103580 Transcript_30745/m.103580 type:complete len:379 (-) Transcript_30745:147-1283(-)